MDNSGYIEAKIADTEKMIEEAKKYNDKIGEMQYGALKKDLAEKMRQWDEY